MSASTLRPNGTTSLGGSVTGAASAHAALADNSDASYVDFDNFETWAGGFGDLSLPSGAVVKSVVFRVRVAAAAGTPKVSVVSTVGNGSSLVTWGVPTTITLTSPAAYSDATIDAATPSFGSQNFAATARLYEAYLDVTYVEKPAVTVDGPTGTLTDTNRPTIPWTLNLDPDGGPQTHYRVRIFTDAEYTALGFSPDDSAQWDTGFTAGTETSWQPEDTLPDGIYRAYVKVHQVVNGVLFPSDYEYSEFEVDVALPATPTLTLTPDSPNARIQIDVAANSGAATTDALEIQRSLDGGTTWEIVRQLEAGHLTPDATVYDYESPNGVATSYRGRALHDYSGEFAASDWATDSATWESTGWWLKHPHRPDLNIHLNIHSFPGVTRASRNGAFQPLGAQHQIIVSDTRGPLVGTVTLRTDTAVERAALDALLDEAATLLLQGRADEEAPGYVRIGNHSRQRFVDRGFVREMLEELEITVVAIPPGNIVAWP